MMPRNRRPGSIRDIATFWTLVVVASLVMAALAFLAGKYWVGGLIAKSTPAAAPRVEVKATDDPNAAKSTEDPSMTEPPPKAVVKIEQRQPTEAERSEIEQKHPQDGAAVHGATGADTPDASTGTDTKLPDAGSGGGQFSVKAGSYTDPDRAQREADALVTKGYSAEIVTVTVKGKTYHRVMVGPYTDRAEADRAKDDLTADGYDASVKTR